MMLAQLLEPLRHQEHSHGYIASPVPQCDNIYVGLDRALKPCVFISASFPLRTPSLRTALVSLQPNRTFQLSLPNGATMQGKFHGLFCDAVEPGDQETFKLVVSTFLATARDPTTATSTILDFFYSLTRLFATAPAADFTANRQGLWGELFLMQQLRGFLFWAPFWHSDVAGVFDFSASLKRVEVKTTAGGDRIHRFSHRQLFAIDGERIVIASFLLQPSEEGLSLRHLISNGRMQLEGTPYIIKLEKAIRHARMQHVGENGPSFNAEHAKQFLQWYEAENAPHFRLPEPSGVSQTSYLVDFKDAPQMDLEELNSWLDNWALEA